MRRLRWFSLAIALLAPMAHAQNAPHLAYVLPAGGQRGSTVQVTIGGQFLPNVTGAFISGGDIGAKVLDYARPVNFMQAMKWRDRMEELRKQPMDDTVRKEMADIRINLLLFNARRLVSPVLAETVKLEINIAAGAPPGKRELRLATPQGLSNPLVFCVGELPEFQEKETITTAFPPGANRNNPLLLQVIQPPTDMAVTLPAVINGRIKPRLPRPQVPPRSGDPFTPGEADRYRFQAYRGQQLVISAAARELIPYLADAVPGWFQAVLALYDANGREVAYDDDYRFHPDPVIHYTVPEDGEYKLEIRDAIYRGREDFVYRISIGELPFVTSVFPLGGKAGAKTKVTLAGWNLPASKLTIDTRKQAPGIYAPVAQAFMPVWVFQVDTLPEALEKEPNDSPTRAQKVKLPVIINGRIDRPGDWDVFRFQGRAGQPIVAEVDARRLGSPLDSVLRLTDAKGKQLAFNDDFEDKGQGLETHHADSLFLTTLPTDGTYYLYIGDVEHKGGPEYGYRLRISAPRPDFELRVAPSAINVSGGTTVPITVHAVRRDGFSGEIALALKDAPRGFTLAGAVIPAGQDEVRVTLTVPPQPHPETLPLALDGRAEIGGREVTHAAVPADDMMQAFAYYHLVPAQDLKVAIRRGPGLRGAPKVTAGQPLKIPAGGTARFHVEVPLPRNNMIEGVHYELSDPPEGIQLRQVSPSGESAEIVLACDARVKPGLKGNLILAISADRRLPANARPQANRQRVPLGTAPAVPFEIVAR
jgi:hypothetical protein